MEAPPSKNTVMGSSPQCRISDFQILPKSAVPPLRMAPGGGKRALRATHSRWGVRYRGELPQKLTRGGTPALGTFWRFWGFPVKTVCNPGLTGNPSQRKRHTDLRGSSQRSSRGSIWALDTQGGQNRPSRGPLTWIPCTPFPPEIPKISKKCPNRGTPLVGQFFMKFPLYRTPHRK